MNKTITSLKAALAVCVCVFATTASWAASGVWYGTVDALWTNSNNWSAAPYPSGTDTASFTNAGNGQIIDISNLTSITSIIYDSPAVAAYTNGTGAANSQTLVLADSGVITLTATAANSQLFNCGLQLGTTIAGSTYTLTNANTSQTLTFNNIFGPASGGTAGAKILAVNGAGNTAILGSIANGGATSMTLTLAGAGTLTLKGTNVYTGNTILNSGKLTLGSDAALPTGNIVSMSGLGTLDLGGYGATINNISASSITNKITDNSSGPGTNTLSITAHGTTLNALIKDGPFKAVAIAIANANASFPSFTNSAANTFSGGLTLKNNGTGTRIRISNPVITVGTPGNITSSTFGTGPIIIGEAATDKAGILFDTVGTNTIVNAIVVNTSRGTDVTYAFRTDTASNTIAGTVTANADVTTGGSGTLTLSNTISGTGGVTLVTGSLILSGINNYAGTTTLTNGTLTLRGNAALPVNSPVSLLNNATLKILQDGVGNNSTINVNNNITLSCPATVTIDVGNNGSANTNNAIACGALNNGTPLNTFNSTVNFTGANGYLQSFSTLRLTGLTGGTTTLKPTTTSVTILGNVENQESGTVAAHYDALALDGTSTGNSILGCISDAPGYLSVGNGDTRVTKSSTSTWTLSGTNTYHGPTTVSAGTLIIGGAGKLGGGNYTNTIANSGVFNYASSEPQVLSGVISGAGTITKTGSGTLTLTAVNTCSGPITNNNGLLVGVTGGTCSNSSVVVQSSGSGVTASLGVRYTSANAQWACTNLMMLAGVAGGNAPKLAFAFESAPSTTVAPLLIKNNLTLDASTTVTVDPVNLAAGTYPLLVYGGTLTGTAPATATIGNGLSGTLAWGTGTPYTTKTLVLTVSGTATSKDPLRWSGVAGTGTWDINNSVNTNWNDSTTPTPVPTFYKQTILGNPVQFEDSQITADQTVTLNSTVNPLSVIVSNSLYRYTVSGSGAINGATGLTKLGTNTFTLATANSYFGPTVVNEGVLALSGLGTLGLESTLTLSGGMVDLGGLSASVGPVNIMVAPASSNILQNGTLIGSSYVANFASGTATVKANLLGNGLLTKSGTGTLVLSGTNNLSGALTVNDGSLILGNTSSNSTGAIIVKSNGTLTVNGPTSIGANTLTLANAAGERAMAVFSANATMGKLFASSTTVGASGAVIQNSGALLVGPAVGGADVLSLGLNGGYGYYQMNGGSLTAGQIGLPGSVAGAGGNNAVFDLYNGTVDITSANGWLVFGWTAGNGVLNLFNGSLITPVGQDASMAFAASGNSFGMINMLGSGARLDVTGKGITRPLNLALTAGNKASVLNLKAGVCVANRIAVSVSTTPSFVNFDGGTLKANTSAANFLQGLSFATIYPGGAVIDTTNAITIAQNLLASTGYGVDAIPLLSNGSGYIGAPVVMISGGSGTGVTAIASVDLTDGSPTKGSLTGITITSRGTGYQPTDVLSVSLLGGGYITQAITNACSFSVNSATGGLTKIGSGTLTLSGINTYGGITLVNNGELTGVTGASCSNSAVSVAATTGNSALFGVSITDNTKQWTCASLTVTNNGNSSDLEFDYGTVVPSLTLAPLNVIGEAAFKTLPIVTVKIGVNSIGGPGTTYPLMTWGTTSGTVPTAVKVISLRAIIGHLTVVGNILTLVIDSNQPITWALSSAGIWDTLATNWVDGLDAQTTYRQTVTPGDQVMFNDSHINAHTAVTLNSTVSPASVTVSNTVYNYTITGSGAIAGTTSLTKLGEGVLTLDTLNTYTGGTILSAGQLNINKATAIGATASRFTINGGLIDNTSAADLTLTANNPQTWNGDFTYVGSRSLILGTGAVTLNNNRQITVSSNTLTVGGVISGAYGLTKAGNGTLTLSANNNYTGNVIVGGGTLNANNTTSLGTLAAGRTITVNAGGTLTLNMNNAVSGQPGITTPAITVNGGTLYVTRYSASGLAAFNNSLVLQNGATMWVNDTADSTTYNAWQFGDWVTISGTSGSVITNGTGGSSRLDLYTNTTFNVSVTGGAGYDLAVYAPLVNQGMTGAGVPAGLTKDGAGTMALYAANTYTGPTFINNGKLVGVTGGAVTSVVTNNAATGTSTLGILITDNIKQWQCNGLTFTSASTGLDFDFGKYILPATTTNFAPLKVNGVVNFTAIPTVTVSAGSITGGTNSVYPLMVCASIVGSAPTAVYVTTTRGTITAHLTVTNGNTLNLVIDTNSGPLNWAASGAGTWDTITNTWKRFNGDLAVYNEVPPPGDQVIFGDTFVNANTAVTLATIVTPTSVTVTNEAYNYILSGSGGITGGTALTKAGSGTFTLGTANTYSGGTFLNGGSLVLGNASALPVGSTLSMSGTGTLDLNGYGATLGNIYVSTTGNTITDNSGVAGTNTLVINNQLSTSASIAALIKDGPSKVVAVGLINNNVGGNIPFALNVASTYSGGLTLKNSAGGGTRMYVNAGVTTVGTAGNITSSPFGRGPIIIGETPTDKAQIWISNVGTIHNDLIVNTPLGTDQTYALRVDNSNIMSGRVTANSDITFGSTGTGSVTLTNGISGAGGLKLSAGTTTVTLSGPNTYAGKTTVSAGTLIFNTLGNVGAGASALGAPTTVANGTIDVNAIMQYNGATTTSDRIFNLTGGSGALHNTGTGLLTLSGGVTGNNFAFLFRGSGNITETGLIAIGSGGVTRTDSGTLILTNPSNPFSGTLAVLDGVISSDTISNSGALSALGQGSTIQLGQNGTTIGTLRFTGASGGSCNRALSIWGNNVTAGGIIENTVAGQTLTLSGNVSMGGTGPSPRLQFIGAGDGVLSGNIISNTLSVLKSGAGTWTFTAANTYTGATTVAGGKLVLSGANGALTNSLSYAITSGGTLLLDNTTANNTNRLRDASAITLDNGTLCFTNTAGAASYYENAGALFVTNSGGTIVSMQAATGRTNILSLAGLTRTGYATLNFVAPGLGASDRNRIFIAGQPNGLIGLWATINTTNYAAYDSSLGVIVAGTGVSITNILAKGPSIIPDDPTLNAWINDLGTGGGITLAAAYTNRIKTLVQNTDWQATTVTMTNQTLLVNEVLVSAGNARALTLGTTVGEGAVAPLIAGGELLLTAAATDSVLTVNAAISNNMTTSSVTKQGIGTVVLAATNIFTGPLSVNNGTLSLAGSNALTTTVVNVGGVAGNNAVMKMTPGSSLIGTNDVTMGTINNGYGAFYLNGGQVLRNNVDAERNFAFGTVTGGYGYFNMSDGYLSSQRIALGINANVGTALARITGGISIFKSYILIGRSNGGIGVMTIDGGSVYHTNVTQNVCLGYDGGRAELNITGGGLLDSTGKPLTVRQAANNPTGIVNLCSGTLIVDAFQNTSPGVALLNFNGGLLKASAASTVYLPTTMTGVYVNGPFGANAGGAKIDTAGKDITFAAPLLAPPGSGVTTISLTTQGSGYIGEPYVSITGDGVGATAVANMVDDGTGNGTYKVASVTVTTPGVNYTTASVSFLKGGATAVAPTVLPVTPAATAPAGLTKLGTGVLTLGGVNTYAGATTISNGTLRLGIANALPTNSVVNVNGGVFDLGGFAVTNGQVNVTSGSIINGTIANSGITVDNTATMTTRLGTRGLTKNGNGTLVLNGPADNFSTGPLVVNSGTLKLSFGPLSDGLSYWLDATDVSKITLNSTKVTAWADSSTNGVNFAQGTAAQQPTYVSNAINGLPVVSFSGMTNRLLASKAANAQTVFIVNKVNGSRSGLDGVWGQSGADFGIRLASTTSWYYPGTSATSDFCYGGQMYINGVSGNTFAASTPHLLTAVSTTLRNWTTAIGDYWANASYWRSYNGYIGEVLVYNSTFGTADRQSIETYLMAKWLGVSSGSALNVSLATGTTLDLGGGSVTLTNLVGSGTVSNGTLTVTGTISPAGTNMIGTLTVKVNTTFSGKLVVDLDATTSDLLAVQGNLTLSSPTLEIQNLQGLSTIKVYTLATCSGTLSGSFSSTNNIPNTRWAVRTMDNKVQLFYKGGTLIRIM